MKKKIIILASIFIFMVAAGFLVQRLPASSPPEEAGEPAVQSAEPASSQLSPELLKNRVLLPAVSFHPGTAGSTLGCAQASAELASFAAEYQLRFTDETTMNQAMGNAVSLLTEEEAQWLQENLPGLIGMIDSAYTDYSTVIQVFGDAGADGTMRTVLADETTEEDWAVLKAALIHVENSAVS